MHTRAPVLVGSYAGTGTQRVKGGKPMPGAHPATQAKGERLSATVRFMRKLREHMMPKKSQHV